jgi:Holliday junction resolvasome RuvABC DNA-binding subunit
MNNQLKNENIADILEQIASLLEVQDANPHRIRAYHNGASRLRGMDESVAKMVSQGDGDALRKLPDIGEGLARVIIDYVHSGYSNVLARLQGEISPRDRLMQVPGIGEVLATRIEDRLDISTLEALEQAAFDGRLELVEGFGPKRVRSVRVSLAGLLSPAAQRRARVHSRDEKRHQSERPDVAILLEIDAEYRQKARANKLKKITPRRFNPEEKAWLPIMHTSQEDWDFTILFSNTARAHQLGKTHDWVVIYYERNGRENQATVVTATHGPLEGKRIVRGREVECEHYYKH